MGIDSLIWNNEILINELSGMTKLLSTIDNNDYLETIKEQKKH